MLDVGEIEQWIERTMEIQRIPGLAVAVLQNGGVAYARGFGVMSAEEPDRRVTTGTLFRIGSVTKVLTATLIMRLVQANRLDLDAPATAYLPWFQLREPGAADLITLRLLLSHYSGLGDAPAPWGKRDPRALEDGVREHIAAHPLVARPGTVFHYSGIGVNLAGLVAQAVMGKPFTQLMDDWVFEPLAMRHSTFDPLVAMTYPMAQGHAVPGDGPLRVSHRFVDNPAHDPAGFAMSTVLDLANLATVFLNDGGFCGRHFLSPELVLLMRTPAVAAATGETQPGLPFLLQRHKGRRMVSHDGAIPEFRAEFALLPDHGAGLVLLWNSRSAGPNLLVKPVLDQLVDESNFKAPAHCNRDCEAVCVPKGSF